MVDLRRQGWETLLCATFAGAFFAFVFFYATAPITDPDFWWHLKSGEVMVQNGGLLQSDPFTYPGDGVVSGREESILKGYWLWQLSAYGLYSLFGFNGISLFNFLTVGAMAGVVAWQMRRQQVDYALAILLMTLGFYLFRSIYYLERPQVISFLLAALLLALLSRVRDGGRLGWPLPLLVMVWANLHGGFVVADLILLCFAAGAVIEYRRDLPRLRHLLGWVALALAASLINPTGGMVFTGLFDFQGSALMTGVSEYQSTWVRFGQGLWPVSILWLLIALYGIGVWSSRRLYWPDLVVVAFLAIFSSAYVRNVGFFAVAMLPTIAFYLQKGSIIRSRSIPVVVKSFIVGGAAIILMWQAGEDRLKRSNQGAVSPFYPTAMTEFILSSGLQGRMYNSYNHGGYLIWKLYPQHRVFIDNRGIDADIYRDAKLMTAASLQEIDGRKEFEVLLDRYAIDYVVQSHVYFDSGRLTPLLKFLLVKPDWIPVYVDHQSFILVRNSSVNLAVIERYRMDKGDFNNKVVSYLKALCNNRPTEVINHVALAEMLIFVGRYGEAEERLAVITRLQPDNLTLPILRNQLTVLRKNS